MIELIIPGAKEARLSPCDLWFRFPSEREARRVAREDPANLDEWLASHLIYRTHVTSRHGGLLFGHNVQRSAALWAVRVVEDLGLTGRILVKRGLQELPNDFRRGMNTMTIPPLSRAFGRLATSRACPEQPDLDYLVVYSTHLTLNDSSLDYVSPDYWVATPMIENMVAHELFHIKYPGAPEHMVRQMTLDYIRGLED